MLNIISMLVGFYIQPGVGDFVKLWRYEARGYITDIEYDEEDREICTVELRITQPDGGTTFHEAIVLCQVLITVDQAPDHTYKESATLYVIPN